MWKHSCAPPVVIGICKRIQLRHTLAVWCTSYSANTVHLNRTSDFLVAGLLNSFKPCTKSPFSPLNIREFYEMPGDLKKSGMDSKRKSGSDSHSSSDISKKAKTEQLSDGAPDFVQEIHRCRMDVCESVDKFNFNTKRVQVLSDMKDFPGDSCGVVYWMSRDQRVQGRASFAVIIKPFLALTMLLGQCDIKLAAIFPMHNIIKQPA